MASARSRNRRSQKANSSRNSARKVEGGITGSEPTFGSLLIAVSCATPGSSRQETESVISIRKISHIRNIIASPTSAVHLKHHARSRFPAGPLRLTTKPPLLANEHKDTAGNIL